MRLEGWIIERALFSGKFGIFRGSRLGKENHHRDTEDTKVAQRRNDCNCGFLRQSARIGIRHSAIGNWQSLVRRRVILRVRNSTPFISLTLTNAE